MGREWISKAPARSFPRSSLLSGAVVSVRRGHRSRRSHRREKSRIRRKDRVMVSTTRRSPCWSCWALKTIRWSVFEHRIVNVRKARSFFDHPARVILLPGLDSISDLREVYQAKQAAGKVKRVAYDETRDRDQTTISGQIRSYPYGASISPERKEDPPPVVPSPIQLKVTANTKNTPKNFVDLNKSASTEAINSAKQRAIDILKQRLAKKQMTPNKNQSLVSADLSSPTSKRPHPESSPDSDASSKRLKVSNNTTDTNNQERFNEIMNMKSSYADLYTQMSLDEIFERYKKKENIEEKLLQIMEREVKVVVCRQCHYTAYKQSVLCKQKQHFVKVSEVKQKFFECIECNKRVFTWSQYPVENCSKCHSLKGFRRTALIRERHGAKFDDEILVLRGEELKFLSGFASYEKLPNVVDWMDDTSLLLLLLVCLSVLNSICQIINLLLFNSWHRPFFICHIGAKISRQTNQWSRWRAICTAFVHGCIHLVCIMTLSLAIEQGHWYPASLSDEIDRKSLRVSSTPWCYPQHRSDRRLEYWETRHCHCLRCWAHGH